MNALLVLTSSCFRAVGPALAAGRHVAHATTATAASQRQPYKVKNPRAFGTTLLSLPRLRCLVAFGLASSCVGALHGADPSVAPPSNTSSALAPGQAHTIPDLGLDLAPVPAGVFMMGSPYSESNRYRDETQHKVTLTRPFWLGKMPVTQGQYEALMGHNPAHFKNLGPVFPVESVSWDDAMAFCRKLTERERAAGRLPAGYAYTLPTEAQREYACRAGTSGRYAGDLNAIAWHANNSDEKPQPVKRKQPNAWGLYDIQGNIWEWCLDWYDSYPEEPVVDPTGPAKGRSRVYRGGAWFHSADLCRSGHRFKAEPAYRGSLLGFRVALSPNNSVQP